MKLVQAILSEFNIVFYLNKQYLSKKSPNRLRWKVEKYPTWL